MRGAPTADTAEAMELRIIPAYAGSTVPNLGDITKIEDHPRVCGEHHPSVEWQGLHRGSSPRMRGAPLQSRGLLDQLRIIPAYAGSTFLNGMAIKGSKDHPRVCGEHRFVDALAHAPKGSSPRMRGAHSGRLPSRRRGGIIPAYAGSTQARSFLPAGGGDHPRVCGEHLKEVGKLRKVRGSSPRMRGARRSMLVRNILAGIIPAYAGSTGRRQGRHF